MSTKNAFFMTLAAAAVATAANAQNPKTGISGMVKDSITNTPESFVTIRLVRPGTGKAIAVATSDENGRFNIGRATASGKYTLEVVCIGKQTLRRNVSVTKGKLTDLGTLLLKENESMLGQATVTAERRLVKAEIDRVSYSMKEDPEAQTNSLLDMLRKVPMVTVDGEDNIKVNGSSGFKVYVNGKPSQMMSSNPSLILKNYPASAIKRVEVITDPGAKYDAEGTSGILNIVTDAETRTQGYTFSPNVSINNRGAFGSLFGMTQIGKLTLSLNFGMGSNKQPHNQMASEREAYNDAVNHLLRSNGEVFGHGVYKFGSIDASYEFDEHNLLTISGGLHGYRGKNYSSNDYAMTTADAAPVYSYNLWSRNDMVYEGYNFSTDYQHTFNKEGQTLTLSYQMNTSPSSTKTETYYNDIVNVPFTLKDRYADPDRHSAEHTGQLDFTTPFGKHHTFSVGTKYTFRLNRSNSEELSRPSNSGNDFVRDEVNSIDYRHRTDILAGYGEYSLKLGPVSTRAGLRYEWSRNHVSYPDGKRETFNATFSDLVPSVNLAYSLKPTVMLKAGYNLRIGRPDISYLSPYVSRPTAESQSYGNPNLDSEKAHNFELGFSAFGTKLNLSTTLGYSVRTNGLTAYTFLNDNNILTTTYGNMLHQKSLTLNAFINWTVAKGTMFTFNCNCSYDDFKAYRYYNNESATNNGFGGFFYGSLSQTLPGKFKLTLHGGGGPKRPSLQGNGSGFNFYGMSISRSFLKEDRLTLTAQAGNFIHPKRTYREETYSNDFRSLSMSENDFLRFGIGVRYRFGSLNTSVKKASRSIENNDVIQQSSSNGSDNPSGSGQGGQVGM